jgi:putative hydrolase of HD superfamily
MKQEVVRQALSRLPRTGWVCRGVEHPETVGEHTDALVRLVDGVSEIISGLDTKKLKRMLQIHDWPESDPEVGDIVTAGLPPEERARVMEDKRRRERLAMERICAGLGREGSVIMALWLEFEAGETLEARIGQQLDKLQAVLKAAEYQRNGQPVVAQDFIDNVRKHGQLTHPGLIKMMDDVEASFQKQK